MKEMSVGDRIRERRNELGLSVEEIGKALNVSRSTIFRYENGDIEKVPVTILEPLAKILDCTPSYLMGWQEKPIVNSAIIKGDNNVNNSFNTVTGTEKKQAPKVIDDENLNEVIRIYNHASIRGKNRILSYAYEIEDSEKAKETPK